MKTFVNLSRLVAGTLAAVSLLAGASAQAADDVTVQLDYIVRANHAMFFVGQEKGFFAQNGINLTAVRKGTGSTDALRLVANGNADFGFADLPTLMVGRARQIPVVALAAVNQRSPLAIISLKSKNPLTKPADLKTLNMGVHPSGSTYVFMKAFFAANNMNLAEVKQSTVSPPYESLLILGRVDAVPGYIDAEVPELEAKTGGPGSLSILLGADYGYKVYGSGLFTSEKNIAEKPDLVQRFVKAYMQSYKYVLDNPQDAVNIIVKLNPEYAPKAGLLAKQLEADVKYTFFSDFTKSRGIGAISPVQWKDTAEILIRQEVLPKDASTTAGYDMRFLDGANPLRR